MKLKADRVVEAELARAMQALARRFVEGDDVERTALLGALGLKPERRIEPSVRVWLAREAEIVKALEERASARRAAREATRVSVATCLGMIRACCENLAADSQRVAKTQAQLVKLLEWEGSRCSAALAELRAVGAVFGPFPAGYSQEWEVDASLASALDEDARRAAIEAQRAASDADAALVVKLREVAG